MCLPARSTSSFIDGPPGLRQTAGRDVHGSARADGDAELRQVACQDADLDAAREDRPWGRNNPRWQLIRLRSRFPDDSRVYAVVWVADDPSETDQDPLTDGGEGEVQRTPDAAD